jgi:hypothetical protein
MLSTNLADLHAWLLTEHGGAPVRHRAEVTR